LDEKDEAFTTMPHSKPTLPFRSIDNSSLSSKGHKSNVLYQSAGYCIEEKLKPRLVSRVINLCHDNNIFSPTTKVRTLTAQISLGHEKERPGTK
jgi:hypothetical protein